MPWWRAAAFLALLGATLGVALDAMHVLSGTTRYADPLFVVAWWTFPMFASAAVALGLGPCAVDRAFGRPASRPSEREVATAMALFVVAYLVSCVVSGIAGAVTIATIAIVAWVAADRRSIGLGHGVAAAVAGSAVEIALVRAGLFSHAGKELAGVPAWLPCLYFCASIGVSTLARGLILRGAAERGQLE